MKSFDLMSPLAGWVTPLSGVPDPVFSQGMLGDGVAIDPTGDTLFAPCDGEVLTIHEARHALSLRHPSGAELILHLGIDTVALGGDGIEALVSAGDTVKCGDPLLKFDLDLLVQRAPAVVTPVIICDAARFAIDVLAQGMISPGEPLLRVRAVADAQVAGGTGAVTSREVEVALAHGLHARPAARIVEAGRGLDVAAFLIHGDKKASAASPVAMLGLGAGHGARITIEASGLGADGAIKAIAAILCDDSSEVSAPRPSPAAVRPGAGLAGVPAAPGLAVGPAYWLRAELLQIDDAGRGPEIERQKLSAALNEVRTDMRTAAAGGGAAGGIINAQLAFLDDPALVDAALAEVANGASAAGAWRKTIEAQAGALAESGDARIAERAEDLRDIEGRVLAALLGTRAHHADVPQGAVILAEELLPSQVAALDPAAVAGIALVRGGPTSHAAILAAGMGLPMAVAFGPELERVNDGTTVLLDADCGTLEADPPNERIQDVTSKLQARAAAAIATLNEASTLCHTRDGTRIEVFANLGSVEDARTAVEQGAEGCGLLRTEFLFLERDTPPSEAEQTQAYQAIADALGDKPLIVRLLDVGGDKPAPYLDLPAEENPALGLRGIRVGLAQTELLKTQLRAILAVTPKGRCRIMAPMVASVAELDAVAAIIEELDGDVPLGVMIETPAAAMTADLLARRAAFLSIGSNDLTQYALAMDRGNAAVAAGADALHPAVLRLVARTCDDARRHDTAVAVCGALAADPLAVPILLGLGVRELSVPPARIAATKAQVRQLTLSACAALAAETLTLDSAAAVRAAVSSSERAMQ